MKALETFKWFVLCLTCTLLQSGICHAQIASIEMVNEAGFSEDYGTMAAADMNNNGRDEILAIRGNELFLLSFVGGEIASETSILSATGAIERFLIFDADADGLKDVWVYAEHGSQKAVYLLTNTGSAYDATLIWTGNTIFLDFGAADLNNNGYEDVVCFQQSAAVMVSNHPDSGFEFASSVNLSGGGGSGFSNSYRGHAFKDLNGDGLTDIIVLRRRSVVSLVNNGDLDFVEGDLNHTFTDDGFSTLNTRHLSLTDTDGNGQDEIVVMTSEKKYNENDCLSYEQFVHIMNDEGGQWSASSFDTGIGWAGVKLLPADLNNDGKSEFILTVQVLSSAVSEFCGSTHKNLVYILKANDTGGYSSELFDSGAGDAYWPFTGILPRYNTGRSLTADITGNGHKDLIFPGKLSYLSPFAVFENHGGDSFDDFTYRTLGKYARTTALIGGDFSGNGTAELLQTATVNYDRPGLNIFTRTAPETFVQTELQVDGQDMQGSVTARAAGDLNGNGRDDLTYIVHRTADQTYTVYAAFSAEGGGWSTPETVDVYSNAAELALADLNGDGKAEIITAEKASGNYTLRIFSNEGETFSAFAPEETYPSALSSLTAADLTMNGTGDISLLEAGGNLRLLINTGTGEFETNTENTGWPDTGGMWHTYADLNGNGAPDLVMWSKNFSSPLLWGANAGQGSFGDPLEVSGQGSYARFVKTGNLNGFGTEQIFTASEQDELIMLQLEDDAEDFTSTVLFTPEDAGVAMHLAVADFTGSGTDDLALSVTRQVIDSEILLLIGEPAQEGITEGLVFVDLNGDGIFNGDDYPAAGIPVGMTEKSNFAFSSSAGNFRLSASSNADHVLLPHIDADYWEVTSSAEQLSFSLDPEHENYGAQIFAGIAPTASAHSLVADLTSAPLRCEGHSRQVVTVRNTGTETAGGTVTVVFDGEILIADAEPLPQTIENNSVTFEFSELKPTQSFRAVLLSEGYGELGEGATATFTASVQSTEGEIDEEVTSTLPVECGSAESKVRAEQGWTEHGFVLAGDVLSYTLIAEPAESNLGEMAVAVSNHLEINSLRPVSWTVEPLISVSSTGVITMAFPENDVTAEPVFVRFAAAQKPELAPDTEIMQGMVTKSASGETTQATLGRNTVFSCEGLADFSADGDGQLCEGETLVSTSLAAWVTSYSWSEGGQVLGTDSVLHYAFPSTGVYDIVLTASNPLCNVSESLIVTIDQAPEAPVIEASGSNLLSVAGIYQSYQWHLDEAPIPGADGPEHELTESGTYTVHVEDENGCGAMSEPYNAEFLSVSDVTKNVPLAYPVPADRVLFVDLPGHSAPDLVFSITDLSGRRLLEKTAVRSERTEFNISGLSPGVYLLSAESAGEPVGVRKVVIAR